MRLRARGPSLVVSFLVSVWMAPALFAQSPLAASDPAKRQEAANLFQQGKRLEALPLLEELAKSDPQDAVVLVELGASLVEHAATLPDQGSAGKERLRARELLNRAWDWAIPAPWP